MKPDTSHNRCRFAQTDDPETAAKICREHYTTYQLWRIEMPSYMNPAGKAYKRLLREKEREIMSK